MLQDRPRNRDAREAHPFSASLDPDPPVGARAIRFERRAPDPDARTARLREAGDVVILFLSRCRGDGPGTAPSSGDVDDRISLLVGPVAAPSADLVQVLQVRLAHEMLAATAAGLGLDYDPDGVVEADARCDYRLAGLGRALVAELEHGSTPRGPTLAAYAQALAGFVLSDYFTPPLSRHAEPVRGGLTRRTLRRVEEAVRARLAEPLTVAELAGIAELSTFHFCREFKRSTGVTPYRFILETRCTAAKALLEAEGPSVLEIALDCGFATSQSFARAFRRVTGMSPTEYRRAAQD